MLAIVHHPDRILAFGHVIDILLHLARRPAQAVVQ